MKLTGKVVVVTGGGSGIGRELVLALLARGAQVAAVDLRQEGLIETQAMADAGDRLSVHVADVTDRVFITELPNSVIAHHGVVDGLINNAGVIQPFVHVSELDFEVIDRMVEVNLMGPVNVTKVFLPYLLARPEAHIANVSSMGGFIPFPGQTMYSAAKAAVKLFTEGLFSELLESNVGVSAIMPGAVNTNIMKNSGVEMRQNATTESEAASSTLSAEDAARIILDGIERNKLHILVGRDAKFLNLLVRLVPRWAIKFIQRQMKSLGM